MSILQDLRPSSRVRLPHLVADDMLRRAEGCLRCAEHPTTKASTARTGGRQLGRRRPRCPSFPVTDGQMRSTRAAVGPGVCRYRVAEVGPAYDIAYPYNPLKKYLQIAMGRAGIEPAPWD